MEAPSLKSVVSVNTFADGRAEVVVSGKRGTFTLEVLQDDITIAIKDPERAKQLGHAYKYKAVFGLEGNGHFRGWLVEKKGPTPADDSLVWFPPRKTRAQKVKKKAKA